MAAKCTHVLQHLADFVRFCAFNRYLHCNKSKIVHAWLLTLISCMHVGTDAAELGHIGCSGTRQKLSICIVTPAVGSVSVNCTLCFRVLSLRLGTMSRPVVNSIEADGKRFKMATSLIRSNDIRFFAWFHVKAAQKWNRCVATVTFDPWGSRVSVNVCIWLKEFLIHGVHQDVTINSHTPTHPRVENWLRNNFLQTATFISRTRTAAMTRILFLHLTNPSYAA